MSGMKLSGAELERAVNDGRLDEEHSNTTLFDALVRKSKKKDHIGLSVAGCDSFVDVPSTLIASAEKTGFAMCGDHGYPRMRIALTISDDPIAQILSRLLAMRNNAVAHSSFRPDHPAGNDPDEDRYHRFRGY
jgi:hypothetical protein